MDGKKNMNIFKPIECNGCVHEYAPAKCPCCEQCEVKKKNPDGFMNSSLTQSENIKGLNITREEINKMIESGEWLLILLLALVFSDK